MCGILGVWKMEGNILDNDINKIKELIKLNMKRGTLAYGLISPTTYMKRIISPNNEDFEFLNKFIGEKYLLIHLRSPTGNSQNILNATQPLIGENFIVLHNGILLEWDKNKYFKHWWRVL